MKRASLAFLLSFLGLSLLGVVAYILYDPYPKGPAWLMVEVTSEAMAKEAESCKTIVDQDLARFPELKDAISETDRYCSQGIEMSGLAGAGNAQGRALIEFLEAQKCPGETRFVTIFRYGERYYWIWIMFGKNPPVRL